MITANLVNEDFSIPVLPNKFLFSKLTDWYMGSIKTTHEGEEIEIPVKMIKIQYQIIAEKYASVSEVANEEGVVSLVKSWVDFQSPVLFDSGEEEIPFGLYLLIESYRNEPSAETMGIINANLALFPFKNSMKGFVFKVSEVI
jgi:hypothetical protein